MAEFKSKQSFFAIIGLCLIIIVITGISYAVYTFTGTGTTENSITSGNLTIDYLESTSIALVNQYPQSDIFGINSNDENNTMNFSITSNITGTNTIYYAIIIDNVIEGSTLKDDYIKIYLKKDNNLVSNFTENVGQTVASFYNNKIVGVVDNYAVLVDTFTNSTTHHYTLTAWVSENYELPQVEQIDGNTHGNTTTSETFKFKIKVVGTTEPMIIVNS